MRNYTSNRKGEKQMEILRQLGLPDSTLLDIGYFSFNETRARHFPAAGRKARAIVDVVGDNAFLEAARTAAPTRISSSSQPIDCAFAHLSNQDGELDSRPLVSLILTVKNGLPYLEEALESVRHQSYRNIELVVQDCLSTDGSTEHITAFDGAPVYARREADDGIGHANNRALERCRGVIIGSIDSDNLLDRDAVARAVEHFSVNPKDAVVYGSVQMISADGASTTIFRPGSFDFLRLISCDLVLPWSTAFFNRRVCGASLQLDHSLKTCADYDAWLRLSHLPIAFMDCVQGSTRISDMSMTCRPENYEQFCADKSFALRRYLAKCAHEPLGESLLRRGLVGIHCWAAESLKALSPQSIDSISDLYARAKAIDSTSSRLTLAAQRLF